MGGWCKGNIIEGLCWFAWLNGVEQLLNREGGLDL